MNTQKYFLNFKYFNRIVCGRREEKLWSQHSLNKENWKWTLLHVTKLSPEQNRYIYCSHSTICWQWDFDLLEFVIEDKRILKEMVIPDHLICLLRNLYARQGAIVGTRYGTTDWFQMGKGVHQGWILSPCLFNLCAEYIMRNTGLEEAQAGIKITGRNINNLRYADDTILMAESEEELEPLDESERGEWKRWLKAQHSEN